MSDIYCRRCGEPWDADDVREDFSEVQRNLLYKGVCCPSCYKKDNSEVKPIDDFEFLVRLADSTDEDPQTFL